MAAVKIHVARVENSCDLKKTKTEPKKCEQVAKTRPKYDQSIFSKCRLYQSFFFRSSGMTPAVTAPMLTIEKI